MTGFAQKIFEPKAFSWEKIMLNMLCIQALVLPFPILWNTYVTMLLVSVSVFLFLSKKRKIYFNFFLISCLAYFTLLTVRIFLFEDAEISDKVKPWERNLSFLFFPLLFSVNAVIKADKEKILRFFTWGCLISSLICIVWAFYRNIYDTRNPADLAYSYFSIYKDHPLSKWIFWDYFLHTELTSILDFHPSYFSLYVAFASLYLIHSLCTDTMSSKKKVFLVAQLIFLSIFIVLLSSRLFTVMYFVLAIGILILTSYRKKKLKNLSITLLLVVLLLYYSPIGNFRITDQLFNIENYTLPSNKESVLPSNLNGINLRLISWTLSLRVIRDHWISGVGYYDAKILLNEEYAKMGYTNFKFNCHNQFLEALLREGIVGFLITILLLFYPLYAAFKNRSILLLVFSVLVIALSFFESIFAVNKGIVFFSFLSSCLIIQKSPIDEKM